MSTYSYDANNTIDWKNWFNHYSTPGYTTTTTSFTVTLDDIWNRNTHAGSHAGSIENFPVSGPSDEEVSEALESIYDAIRSSRPE
jgi:hypothetical protein